jgi:AcrR family transcriptional regulator
MTPAPATARAAQAERTRQAVLDAARTLFADRGYAAASLQDIADAMGVVKANVYYYFRTKAAILDALLDERIAALERMLDVAEAIADRKERRDLLVDGFVDEVVTAHRTLAPIDFADPAIRSQPGIAGRLDVLADRAARALFGPAPTPAEIAGLALVLDLKPVLRRLTHLPDAELRDVLRGVCRRLLAE